MTITWRELREQMERMDEARLNDTATIFDSASGECFAIAGAGAIEEMDQQGDVVGVLDDGHFVIKTQYGLQPSDRITVDLKVFDNEGYAERNQFGNVVYGTTSDLTLAAISDIIDHASQLVLVKRDGGNIDGVMTELENALVVYDESADVDILDREYVEFNGKEFDVKCDDDNQYRIMDLAGFVETLAQAPGTAT